MKTIPQILEEFDKLKMSFTDINGDKIVCYHQASKSFLTEALTQILDELPTEIERNSYWMKENKEEQGGYNRAMLKLQDHIKKVKSNI
jgi:hypothetical protein